MRNNKTDVLKLLLESSTSKYQFKIEIMFRKAIAYTLKNDDFLLNCTPLVNLYSCDAEPIHISGTQYEYPVVPEFSLLLKSMLPFITSAYFATMLSPRPVPCRFVVKNG